MSTELRGRQPGLSWQEKLELASARQGELTAQDRAFLKNVRGRTLTLRMQTRLNGIIARLRRAS